ncbi:MAG TPA: response regulator [Spirochaetota bacterium]|jgi:two-component system alkaline phosphatase synthesis response regulator PhoP|nr:response regulator [Spirochaetota bacterium]HOE20226.1 response regulator [Spirochaetota bacterium]HQQ51295.1 response regulator [Spirochaetota bacterium]
MANKKLILVIDDDPDILDSIKAILAANGFDVVTAMSGKEGIEAVSKNKPDLILCDMMMERIDAGTKVAQELKKNNPNLPIYLLSSIGTATATNIEIDKLGFNGVFQKPVNPDNLVAIIKKALNI